VEYKNIADFGLKHKETVGGFMELNNEEDKMEEVSRTVQMGRYRHYKGKEYEVIGIAKHSENLEEFVVYRALYGDGQLWIRPREMFLELIPFEGQIIPRFEYFDE
jgi:hypothetical protein